MGQSSRRAPDKLELLPLSADQGKYRSGHRSGSARKPVKNYELRPEMTDYRKRSAACRRIIHFGHGVIAVLGVVSMTKVTTCHMGKEIPYPEYFPFPAMRINLTREDVRDCAKEQSHCICVNAVLYD
jgi:hypothetical protein